ncbi:membrane protein insertase YidC [Deinococcus pimensis]|uniref:membrane protein insertase YidC n=1 Tax=Deinococcus pimensis TaxID=309888 RepID=UPI0004BCBE37|nr:membrane protein insertase YidC [Deinococcus pimensis]
MTEHHNPPGVPASARRPRPFLRAAAALLPLALLGAAGSASAAVNPGWIEADFNGDGQRDLIATSNLGDIVFNTRGEIVGWYPKVYAGTPSIKLQEGALSFGALKNPRTVNLVKGNREALVVRIPGNTAVPSDATFEATPTPVRGALPTKSATAINRLSATFRYTHGAARVEKTVSFSPRQFRMSVRTNVTGADGYTVNFGGLNNVANPTVKAVAQGSTEVLGGGDVKNIRYAAIQQVPNPLIDPQSQNKYAIIVRPQDGTRADATVTGGQNANIAVELSGTSNLQVYGGKNELIRLYKEGFLQEPGLFSPNLLGYLSLLIARLMDALHALFLSAGIASWGLVIAALTVLIRLAIWPIMQGQMRYTTRMQFIQPEVQKLNEQYKDDPQKRAEATMALYREHNVNPAGCLPVFIQIPILAVLWNTIRNFEFDGGLLWLPDLSIPDPLYILAALYVIANLVSIYISTRKTPQMFKQQAMIYVFFAYFALTFPAGVTLYWILSTIIGIFQQLLINRQMEHLTATANVQKVAGGVKGAAPSAAAAGPTKTVKPVKPALDAGSVKSTPKKQKE